MTSKKKDSDNGKMPPISGGGSLEKCRKALAEAEKKATLLDLIPTPAMAIDREFNVTYLNQAGASAVGKTAEACMGQKCFSLFNTGHCNTHDCQLAKAMQQDGVFTNDTVAKLPSGELPIRYTGAPLKDEKGNIIGALEFVLDISKEVGVTDGILDLVGAVTEGKLDVRADADKYEGNYKRIVEGVNSLVDAFVGPINVTAEYVDRISKGDIPEKITDEYKGDFNEIKNNLNVLIDSLNALINEAATMEKAAAAGELDTRADVSKYNGAWATIVQGLNDTFEGVAVPLRDIGRVLDRISTGDLTVNVVNDYTGDYNKLKEACNRMVADLNNVLGNVNIAVEQIAAGSQQVSDSAQALSQGATEQASSLEEITSSMNEIASQTKQNAENATQANQLSADAKNGAENGNSQMKEMVGAMEEINESSQNISKIIKVIDEIAFQTNLLALNAAVEAARAGKHGKGFAVVAEEVRNLAARSAKAAKETAELIEGSVEKVEQGTQMANKTAEALDEIVAGVTKVTDLVGEIAAASNEQAQGVSQINVGLGQIDQVTQQNTATAEESASASEELSSQAAQLREMIARFKLAQKNGKGQVPGMEQITPEMMEMLQKMMRQQTAPAPATTGGGNGKDTKGGNGKTQWGGVEHAAAQQNTVAGAEPVIALDDKEFGRF